MDKIIDETKQYFEKEIELLLEATQELKSRRNTITELEEKIEALEKQIESMKNCENCIIENISKCMELGCKNYDKWELKE